MNRTFKKCLVAGTSLLLLAGISAGFNGVNHSAHASMPDPEYYHSTSRRGNVYYGIGKTEYGEGVNYLLYGQMPKAMQKRGHVFALYYGKQYDREVANQHTSLDRVLHRRGQTYLPDYVGYTIPRDKINYRGHRGYIEDIFVNKKDIARPVRNQNNPWLMEHDYLRSVKYVPAGHYRYHRGYRRARRNRYRRPRIRRRARRPRRVFRRRYRIRRFVKHYRKARRYRKRRIMRVQIRRRHRVRRHAQANPYWINSGYPTSLALDDASSDLINDINSEREAHGLNDLTSESYLNNIAVQRANQLFTDGFTHYDSDGNMYLIDDANDDGDSLGDAWGENIGNTDGYSYQTPQQIADTFNQMLYVNEKGATPDQDGPHRKNILSPNYSQIGVGFYTDGHGTTNMAEDFAD